MYTGKEILLDFSIVWILNVDASEKSFTRFINSRYVLDSKLLLLIDTLLRMPYIRVIITFYYVPDDNSSNKMINTLYSNNTRAMTTMKFAIFK